MRRLRKFIYFPLAFLFTSLTPTHAYAHDGLEALAVFILGPLSLVATIAALASFTFSLRQSFAGLIIWSLLFYGIVIYIDPAWTRIYESLIKTNRGLSDSLGLFGLSIYLFWPPLLVCLSLHFCEQISLRLWKNKKVSHNQTP